MTIDTSNISKEKACVEKKRHQVGEKSNEKERETAVQFPFYKDKINVLRKCKKLKGAKF